MNTSSPVRRPRRGPRKKSRSTNLTINKRKAELAKEWFRKTGYQDLSGFLDAKIDQEFRKNLDRIRAAGIEIPADLLAEWEP